MNNSELQIRRENQMSLKKRISAVLALVLLATIGVPAAGAAAMSDLTVDQQIEIVRSLNEAAWQATVAANVERSREAGDAFWPIYRSYRGEVSNLNDSLKAVILKRFAKALPQLDAARVIQLENKLDALSLAELAFDVPLIQAH